MPTLRERSDGGNTVVRNCSTCNLKCGRFIIECNDCSKYYFLSCHEITKPMAEQMSCFYCLPCRRKNPSLHVTYRETPHEKGVRIVWIECSVLRHEWEQLQDGRQYRRRPSNECDLDGRYYRPEKCICTIPNECSPYSIQCQRCGGWCHYECEGFTFKTANDISAYYCIHCRRRYLSIEYRARHALSHSSGTAPKRPRTMATNNERNDDINEGNPRGASSPPMALLTQERSSVPPLQSEATNQSTEQKAPDADHPQESQQHAVSAGDAHAAELLASRTRVVRFGQIFRGKNRLVHANNSSVRELQATINQKSAVVRKLKEFAQQQAEELQRSKDESSRIMEKNSEIRDLQDRLDSANQQGQSTSTSAVVQCDHVPEIQRLKEENQQLATKVRDREAVIVRLTLAANGFHS